MCNIMQTTDKYSCRFMAQALKHYGITRVVVSPGSRNAPLIVALARTQGLECTVVVDERSAAFVALGMAVESHGPVALACTSGSAALNYAPALAEAFYRQVPLIAITADRPEEWIDQDDGQTIRQAGALDAVVKGSFNIPPDHGAEPLRRMGRRRICDAIALAGSEPCGPVHVNIQIDEPINGTCDDSSDCFTFPSFVATERIMSATTAQSLAEELDKASRVMVLAGFMPGHNGLSESLAQLPPHWAVLCEEQSNLRGPFDGNIDASLRFMEAAEKESLLSPDIVVTIGGSLTSRMIKAELRGRNIRHWHVGLSGGSVDSLLHLEKNIACTTHEFFEAVAPRLHTQPEARYRNNWLAVSERARKATTDFMNEAPWSDFSAMGCLLASLPSGIHLHLSNGTAVRYAQLFGCSGAASVECNRGVSGIDGCTSTALGAAIAAGKPTLIVSGDMCAQYDMAALAMSSIPDTFRIAVLNNSGGGIFRFIKATRDMPELEHYLAADVRLPLKELADGFGFDYYEAHDKSSLEKMLPAFFSPGCRPAILNMITPAETSAQIIKDYFYRK